MDSHGQNYQDEGHTYHDDDADALLDRLLQLEGYQCLVDAQSTASRSTTVSASPPASVCVDTDALIDQLLFSPAPSVDALPHQTTTVLDGRVSEEWNRALRDDAAGEDMLWTAAFADVIAPQPSTSSSVPQKRAYSEDGGVQMARCKRLRRSKQSREVRPPPTRAQFMELVRKSAQLLGISVDVVEQAEQLAAETKLLQKDDFGRERWSEGVSGRAMQVMACFVYFCARSGACDVRLVDLAYAFGCSLDSVLLAASCIGRHLRATNRLAKQRLPDEPALHFAAMLQPFQFHSYRRAMLLRQAQQLLWIFQDERWAEQLHLSARDTAVIVLATILKSTYPANNRLMLTIPCGPKHARTARTIHLRSLPTVMALTVSPSPTDIRPFYDLIMTKLHTYLRQSLPWICAADLYRRSYRLVPELLRHYDTIQWMKCPDRETHRLRLMRLRGKRRALVEGMMASVPLLSSGSDVVAGTTITTDWREDIHQEFLHLSQQLTIPSVVDSDINAPDVTTRDILDVRWTAEQQSLSSTTMVESDDWNAFLSQAITEQA